MSDELLDIFVTEGRELLDQAGQDLLALERAPDDLGALESLFRAAHTLKGSAGLVGFGPMGELFHAAEDRLSEVRRGDLRLGPGLAQALLAAVWQAERWLQETAQTGRLPAGTEAGPLTAALAATDDATAGPAPAAAAPARDAGWAQALLTPAPEAPGPYVAFRYTPRADSYFAGEDPVATAAATPELLRLALAPRAPFGDLAAYDPFACNLVLTGLSAAPLAAVREAFRFAPDEVELAEVAAPAEAEPTAAPAQAVRTMRVESGRIDALAAAVDELVVAKNALAHLTGRAAAAADPGLGRALAAAQADLDRRIGRLHDSVTRLRLTPLAPLFRRFPALVRQTADGLGKQARLVLSGEDVEVDKSVADGLFEPLLHLVRNALDHGVEPPERRRAAGKPAAATLRIAARPMGDEVVIEVSDDGRGIDLQRVRRVAAERGVMDEAALAALSDDAAAELIFAPGFSTAQAVTDLSGRGVGLDAVRAAVAALGGRTEIATAAGAGTRIALVLPLRVRLARLMVVEAGGESFGVPLESVVETAQVAASRLTPVRAGRALVWRDRPVPLLDLSDLLRLPGLAPRGDELKLMIVQAGDDVAAVSVDAFGARLEAPLRPMAGLLSRVPGLAGTTLMGDGRVLMVLDMPELIG
ncbi:chemotaxis protein CheA [Phenylobacterium sp.]|uniref:chemotaxis protein CheA n=1 Tax=Phenylobacterium sp. TaxID=1871053 RepID=UPI0035B44F9D